MSDKEFKRYTNFDAKHFDAVAGLKEAYGDKLVYIPNKDGIYCY